MFLVYFAKSANVFWAPLFLLPALLIFRNFYFVRSAATFLAHSSNFNTLLFGLSIGRLLIKSLLTSTALLLLFVAFLRPQWGKKERVVVQEGRDLVILLDVSRSMLSPDLNPSRLEFAKLKVRKLLERLPFERVGLILFSGSAFSACPITSDKGAFLMFLNQVDSKVISSGTTAIDKALLAAIDVFKGQPDRKNKLVLLLTDGEDFSTNLEGIERAARKNNLKIFALGIGSQKGGPIPIIDPYGVQVGHEKDEKGRPIFSFVNDELLQKICKSLGGYYLRSAYDDSDIDSIADSISTIEKEKSGDFKFSLYEEQYPIFAGLAFLFLLLEWVL